MKTKPKSKTKVAILIMNPDGSVPSEAWKAYLALYAECEV